MILNKQLKLLMYRRIFVLLTFIIFGIIIIYEKKETILLPKVDNKINTYINENYNEIKNNLIKGKTTYKNNTFTKKIINKNNKNHFFYIKYKKRKIKDTYKKDYLQGKQLLNNLESKIKKTIKEKTNYDVEIKSTTTLNNYSKKVQSILIEEKNIEQISFYNIEIELIVKWDKKEIYNEILKLLTTIKENNINPKNYIIIISNKENIIESINDIIDNNNSNVLHNNNIKYEYLN